MPRLLTKEEKQRRKLRFQIFAGMFDFLAVIAGIIVVIICAVLLSALIDWVKQDAPVTFRAIMDILNKAIILPK